MAVSQLQIYLIDHIGQSYSLYLESYKILKEKL